jgi:hypothetical protein
MNRNFILLLALASITINSNTFARDVRKHISLLPFVQEAPDQGDTATCLFMGSTGSVELLLNKKYNIRFPNSGDLFDFSERFTINHSARYSGSWHQMGVARFNDGWSILDNDLPFTAWTTDGQVNRSVWKRPSDFYKLPRVEFSERFKSTKLFVKGRNRYSKYVLNQKDIQKIKDTLDKTNSPILVNYNHRGWWHVVNIVGYDDGVKGECLHTPNTECSGVGAFYVRDSLGKDTHLRDYDWFRVNGNAAFVVEMIN